MNIKNALITVLAVGSLIACNKFKVTKTENGDRYQIHTSGGKKTPKEGDILTFELVIHSEGNDTLKIKDSYAEGVPVQFALQKGAFKGSFENALFYIAEGDSATIFVNADSLYSRVNQPLPPEIKKGSDLLFKVKMLKVQSQDDFKKAIDSKKNDEGKLIQEFVSKNLPNATKTADGIFYSVKKAGTGATPAKGDTVVVHYTGKFLDGKQFDSSVGKDPISFPVGMNYVIVGWEKTLMSMKKGESATVVIPSSLGYGEQGSNGVIEPFTPLVFDMELIDIKK